MNTRTTFYLDKTLVKRLDMYENKSKIVKEALYAYLSNEKYVKSRILEVENNIADLECQLKNEKTKLELHKGQLNEIRQKKSERPVGYKDSVATLKRMQNVTEEDMIFQAKKLAVNPGMLRQWLCDDGYYDKITTS